MLSLCYTIQRHLLVFLSRLYKHVTLTKPFFLYVCLRTDMNHMFRMLIELILSYLCTFRLFKIFSFEFAMFWYLSLGGRKHIFHIFHFKELTELKNGGKMHRKFSTRTKAVNTGGRTTELPGGPREEPQSSREGPWWPTFYVMHWFPRFPKYLSHFLLFM
jgi:hypothetical protein